MFSKKIAADKIEISDPLSFSKIQETVLTIDIGS